MSNMAVLEMILTIYCALIIITETIDSQISKLTYVMRWVEVCVISLICYIDISLSYFTIRVIINQRILKKSYDLT